MVVNAFAVQFIPTKRFCNLQEVCCFLPCEKAAGNVDRISVDPKLVLSVFADYTGCGESSRFEL